MSEQASTKRPGQGWYTDPQDPARLRWWDGASWTEHVHPPAGQAEAETQTAAPGVVSPATPDARVPAESEKGAIGRWLSARSNVALLVVLVIAVIVFILVMSGALT